MIGCYFGWWWLLAGAAVAAAGLAQLKDEASRDAYVADVRNLSVVLVMGESDVVKFNVSWLPPIGGKRPRSYSVQVTSEQPKPIPGSNDNITSNRNSSCVEGSIYHVSGNVNRTYVLLPESKFVGDAALELDIRPGCTYRVHVHGNPRAPRRSPFGDEDSTSVVISVPECVNGHCNCERALAELPVPAVSVRNLENGSYFVSWRVGESPLKSAPKERIPVKSYQISVGLPHLTSASGKVVYNRTNIFTTSANDSYYVWTSDAYKKGMKISVTAQDEFGCSGKEGFFLMKQIRSPSTYRKSVFILIAVLIIGLCLLASGVYGIVKYYGCLRNCRFIPLGQKHRQIHTLFQNPRIEALLKHHNVLYIDQEIEDARRKDYSDKYEISYSRLRIVSELGHGQFGKVYLANLLRDESAATAPSDLVAVKMSLTSLDSAREQLELRQELLEEIGITKLAGSHPHLVGLVGCCTMPSNPVCLVLEYMSGGDLLGYLHKVRDAAEAASSCLESPNSVITTSTTLSNHSPSSSSPPKTGSRIFFANYIKPEDVNSYCCEGPISHAETMRFALEIAKGMEHLEAKGIVHRDLAARNILMDDKLTLKISDFGLSRKGAYTLGALNGPGVRRLPIRWMPPEAIRRRAFTSKSDVWSYGLVLWEIASLGDFPYPKISDGELMEFLLEQEGRPEPIGHGEMRETMDMCWARKPESRPNFRQIVRWLESKSDFLSKNNPAYQELAEVVEYKD